MSQFYPLERPIQNSIENSPVPRELVLKIKEELQKGMTREQLEDKYSSDMVHQVLGDTKNSVDEEKKENASFTDEFLMKKITQWLNNNNDDDEIEKKLLSIGVPRADIKKLINKAKDQWEV